MADVSAGVTDQRAALRANVRLSTADYTTLDRLYPGLYPRVIVAGDGAYLIDAEGRRLLDSGAHMGACSVGHGRAEIGERIAAQITRMEFSTLDAGFAHPAVLELTERLKPLVPLSGEPLFLYSSSGSEAIEAAVKVARSYHAARGEPGRVKILCRTGSYHGSTYAAMSATGIPAAREPFAPLVPGFIRTSQPSPGRCGFCTRESGCTLECAEDIEAAIQRETPGTVAAMIGEPVPLREAIKVPHGDYWPRVREICDRHGVLLISDEVITGFGRTGRMFGCDNWDLQPDIVVLAKGLTSGYVPMSACITNGTVGDVVRSHPITHISTYAGHPAGCAAALATVDILEREGLPEHARDLEPVVRQRMEHLTATRPSVFNTSVIGLLGSIEFALADGRGATETAARLAHELYGQGLIARTAAEGTTGVVYFYPPLVVTEEDVDMAFAAFNETFAALETAGHLRAEEE